MTMTRRDFLKTAGIGVAGLIAEQTMPKAYAQYFYGEPNKPRLNGRTVEPVYSHSKSYPRSGSFSHSDPSWQEIRDGLYFTRIEVSRAGKSVDSIGLVKAVPEHNKFQVFHDYNLKTIEEWQKHTGADVVFNSSYYQNDHSPCGLIIMDGKMKGPKTNKAMTCMFVAEPTDGKPRAKIINLRKEKYDPSHNIWNTGVQSFPMLLDEDGNIGTGKSNWYANRTAVCDDHKGDIIALTTEGGYFSLQDMGLFLKESRLGIKNALNMDGGYEGDMMVRTRNFDYLTYGQWETQGTRDISMSGAHILLPAVVGIFPRK
ncbi:MAG: phosphodiester glycosidase family protein [Candidatus Aenigmarchaeota archaeon]|nr:phosphodiester glycosidase family protein [Candidatus Aenigmarchaeota archaeon]